MTRGTATKTTRAMTNECDVCRSAKKWKLLRSEPLERRSGRSTTHANMSWLAGLECAASRAAYAAGVGAREGAAEVPAVVVVDSDCPYQRRLLRLGAVRRSPSIRAIAASAPKAAKDQAVAFVDEYERIPWELVMRKPHCEVAPAAPTKHQRRGTCALGSRARPPKVAALRLGRARPALTPCGCDGRLPPSTPPRPRV